MREIKFRAWHKPTGIMLPDVPTGVVYLTGQFHYSECQYMQFTGLKDKNGKEIYEGDILKLVKHKEYKQPPAGLLCTVTWNEDTISFSGLKDNKRDGEYILNKYLAMKHWEVMGNIYENPDLLTV